MKMSFPVSPWKAAQTTCLCPVSAASSLRDEDALVLNAESELQLVMLSESFHHSLLVMERCILGNAFQPKLAAYRQLPVTPGNAN